MVAAAALFALPPWPAERLWRAYFVVTGFGRAGDGWQAGGVIQLLAGAHRRNQPPDRRACGTAGRCAWRERGIYERWSGRSRSGVAPDVVPAYRQTVSQAVAMEASRGSPDTSGRVEAAALMAREPGAVLTDEPDLALLAGKRVEFEFVIYTILAAQGSWNETPILDAIQARQFGLVVMTESLDVPPRPLMSSRLTENLRAALQTAYRPAGLVGSYWVYRPS